MDARRRAFLMTDAYALAADFRGGARPDLAALPLDEVRKRLLAELAAARPGEAPEAYAAALEEGFKAAG
ncbi:hypothetical protein EPO15_04320 [bacterium]|nr:MAG: hypothetical protein EPO15_04320 [bacterium]